MSFERRGLGALVAGLLGLAFQSPASAGDLDRRLDQPAKGTVVYQVGNADLGVTSPIEDAIVLGDLQPTEDFHPETDRWTERTNRIRITPWWGYWGFSHELAIEDDVAVGIGLRWEVPGFIGIRLDYGAEPWSRLNVRIDGPAGSFKHHVYGVVHAPTLSIGIFNPELSIKDLAFWAGLGGGLFIYSYHSNFEAGHTIDYDKINFAGNVFIELDYKIVDQFHIGVGLREHVIFAPQTDDGRFWDIDSASASHASGRNGGLVDTLATCTELTMNISVLF